ncbi:MAG: pyridoxal-5'-phosphate-dependent protein [Thaumarchaeota archaeon]|nr:pyridoxal-5'-phosphate-dependent protein [Nitrososphaerota archaeon]|tara:strand:- start:4777 stop:5889 length:1113 start_codon:yes stop_codon:yes gene_type:complete
MTKKISVNEPVFDDNEVNTAQTILDSGLLSSSNMYGGKYVKLFEKQLTEFLNCKYAIAVNSGTSALYASLLSLGVTTEDEVIVPSFSFTATASAVIATGATPIFVDISSSNYNIDLSLIKSHISSKTKAIIPVHLYGHPVDVVQLSEITSANNIPIIEDGAQSLGSSINGKKCGTLGNLGCTSLYPTKVITSGEGGVITTNDEELYNQLLMIRNHGLDKSGHTIRFGLNLRMPEIEAALASIQLSKLDDFIKIRRTNSNIISEYIDEFDINIPIENDNSFLNRYLYTVSFTHSRDEIMSFMEKQGINTAVYYRTPIHKMPFYQTLNNEYELPNTDIASSQVLSIPIHSGLSNDDINHVGRSLNYALKSIY